MKLITLLLGAIFALSINAADITLTRSNHAAINQPITSAFIAEKQLEIMTKASKLKKGSDFYLVLFTPGGEVFSGSNFIDSIKALDIKVHTITIFAASMGYQFAQNFGTRYIIPSGVLMSHRASAGGVAGQINGELNSRVQFLTDVSNRLDKIAASRTSQTFEEYQKSIVNELWVVGENAVSKKHADEVANVKCDDELVNSTYESSVDTMFGSVKVEFSSCPLITQPTKVSARDSRAKNRVKLLYSKIVDFVKNSI